jgi:type VI secretion system protein ImpK
MPSDSASHAQASFPLVSRFFEFWEEVADLRRQVETRGGSDETFSPAAAGGRERLAETLRAQRADASRSQEIAPQHLEEAQYVMAATADELFIGLKWDGAAGWTMRPLEVELFGTRRAGEEVFARIDRLVSGFRPVQTEMAAVYLNALELGFKGQFAEDHKPLDAYESRLRELLGRRPLTMGPLVPECYAHTTVAGTRRQLPGSRVWWSAAVAIGALALLALLITLTRFRGSPIEDARQRLETSLGRSEVIR